MHHLLHHLLERGKGVVRGATPLARGLRRAWTAHLALSELSLFWRTCVLLGMLMLCSTVAWLLMFRTQEYEPRVLRTAHQIATVVNLTRTALMHVDASGRTSLLHMLADEEDVRLVRRRDDDQLTHFGESAFEDRLADALVQRLGASTLVASGVNGQSGLWVGFQIDADRYWLQMDAERLRALSQGAWLMWLALAAALSLLGAAAITTRINHPLHMLSQAASRVREGRYHEVMLDERASAAEIRAVNAGFNRMAERLAKVQDERNLMLEGISHDLRTPLARLRLEAELSVPDRAAQQAMCDDIEQLDAIIGKFLDYARSEHSALQPVALAPMLAKCTRPFANAPRMCIDTRVADDVRVWADPVEVGRVLANVLENARLYGASASDGVSRIDITVQVSAGRVSVQVRDHGPGVPAQQLPHLTLPFYRADAARTAALGSGLGLAVAAQAVARMNGHLSLHNHATGGLVVSLDWVQA